MATDTRIGLLLGSCFILAIVLLVNGLPRSLPPQVGIIENHKDNTGDIDMMTVGLADKEWEVYDQLMQEYRSRRAQTPAEPNKKGMDPASPQGTLHIVCENENLALIAQHYYGKKEGNRQTHINRIFNANRNVLSSPDRIRVGQKLMIPPLVKERETIPPDSKEHPAVVHPTQPETKLEDTQEYTVKDGDSLWKIAVSTLGNGSRYQDIVQMNRDLLTDENRLKPGMRLSLPSH
jgi:nucleoid-associated protein YgaU